ncbi:MAG: hypothetical protein V4558_02345 [Gemmatimonadota bacterium]
MRIHSVLASVLVSAVVAGCGGSPTDANQGSVFLAVTGSAAVGTALDAHLVNHSEVAVRVGWLPCYVMTDRRVGDRWSEIPRENQACIMPVYTINPGAEFAFPLTAPTTPGTFRLRTIVGDDSVFSSPFVVR